jgi:DNA-binding transcriptional LysR family regulator
VFHFLIRTGERTVSSSNSCPNTATTLHNPGLSQFRVRSTVFPARKPTNASVMPLFSEQMMIVVHSGHPLARRNTIRLPILRASPISAASTAKFYGCSLFDGCSAWNMIYRSGTR